MDTSEITKQIMGAWDEEEPTEEEPTAEVEQEDEPTAEADDTEETDEGADEEPADEDEDTPTDEVEETDEDETEDETEEEVAAAYESENPRVQAYLNKYQGDVDRALAAATQLEQVLGRQGQEKAVLTRKVAELEQELQRAKTFGAGIALSPEQRTWAEEAASSGNPSAYVQQAIDAGEFGLARAVCDQWAEEAPYEAGRIAQHVDAAEWQSQQVVEEPVDVDRDALMDVLVQHFPDMPQYEQQMLTTMQSLGDGHPLVHDARSNDPETAARGVLGIYEIARARTTSVKTAREKVQREGRKAADDARAAAVVSSAQASPSLSETPRPKQIMPGLTLADLDDAFEKSR